MGDVDNEIALAKAIRDRLGVTQQRISQRVKRLRDNTPMSRAEALGVLGHEVGLRINDYLVDSTVARVRDLISMTEAVPTRPVRPAQRGRQESSSDESGALRNEARELRAQLRAAGSVMPFQIADDELRDRCLDLLNARGHFDRAVNQAHLVLEDRVRRAAELTNRDTGRGLVNRAISDEGPLVFSSEPAEQEAARALFNGMVGLLRNPTGHRLGHRISKEDAIAIVGFVDYLLRRVDRATTNT